MTRSGSSSGICAKSALWKPGATGCRLQILWSSSSIRAFAYTHEDLGPNMWGNPGETGFDADGNDKASNGRDDDGNGYVDDVHGIDVVAGDSDQMDEGFVATGVPFPAYHGTSCAGIIAAVSNNGKGIAGLAGSTGAISIMAIRALWHDVDREFNQVAYKEIDKQGLLSRYCRHALPCRCGRQGPLARQILPQLKLLRRFPSGLAQCAHPAFAKDRAEPGRLDQAALERNGSQRCPTVCYCPSKPSLEPNYGRDYTRRQ
jgi:hypothetical protein